MKINEIDFKKQVRRPKFHSFEYLSLFYTVSGEAICLVDDHKNTEVKPYAFSAEDLLATDWEYRKPREAEKVKLYRDLEGAIVPINPDTQPSHLLTPIEIVPHKDSSNKLELSSEIKFKKVYAWFGQSIKVLTKAKGRIIIGPFETSTDLNNDLIKFIQEIYLPIDKEWNFKE